MNKYLQICPEVTMDCASELCRRLSPSQRAEIIRTLTHVDLEDDKQLPQ